MTSRTTDPARTAPRLRVPTIAVTLLVLAPFLLLFGYLTMVGTSQGTYDLSRTPTMVGTVMFWVGVASLMTGLALVGVRAIAQQQLDVLLGSGRGR